MAETITNVLQITTQDTDNNSYSFNVENPNDGVTIQQVNAALDPLINTQKWYSTKNKPIVRVKNATLTRTRKIILEDSTEITVTPADWTGNASQNVPVSKTFTVTGEAIQGFKNTTNSNINLTSADLDTASNSYTFTIVMNSQGNVQGNFKIITTTQILEIPINISIS